LAISGSHHLRTIMPEETLFVVRTEREDFLFRHDNDRDLVICYPLTKEAGEKTQITVFDLRMPATEGERSMMQSLHAKNPGRYIAMNRNTSPQS
jgi:hypothetical protein